MTVTIRVLGPVEATRAGHRLDLGTVRQRAVLALLALEARRVVPIDAIVDSLWGDDVPAKAEASVRSYVSNLRRALEPDRPARTPPAVLLTSGTGYALEVDEGVVDALAFGRIAASAVRFQHEHDWSGALAAAAEALDCWRGPALVDLLAVPFAPGAAARLEGERSRQDLIRLRSLVELRRPDEALAGLEARVEDDPLDEAATGLLMRALYSLGRPTEALDRYETTRDRLADHGLLPGPALRDLEGSVLRHDIALDPSGSLPVARADRPVRPPTLVGRGDAWDALTRVGGGEPRWTVVTGPAGMGKTFLAEALAAGFTGAVHWARARRDDDQPALWLWQQLLADLDVGDDAELPSSLAAFAATVVERLRTLARRSPVLVVLDDVQWADSASLAVLAQVATDLRNAAVELVLTVRPSPDPTAVDIALAEVLRQTGARRVELEPFGAEETSALARSLDTPVTDAEAATLRDTADGNPLVLRELLQDADRPRASRLPDAIVAMVAGRLDPMPGDTAEVLQLAALAGDDIDGELLAAALALPVEQVIARLHPAMRGGLVLDDPLRFRHATTRDVVLAALEPADRRSGHARIAAAMAGGGSRWSPARLVHHQARARPLVGIEDLVEAARVAGAEAAALGAFAEQARLLELPLADAALPREEQLPLLIDAAEARTRAGLDLDAHPQLAAALDLAVIAGDTEAAGRAATVLARGGGAWYWVPYNTHPTDLLGRLDRAAAAAATAGDETARASILAAAAVGESYGPDPARPGRLAAEALALARARPAPGPLAEALVAASWAGFGVGRPVELLALADELAGLEDHLPPERRALAQAFRLTALLRLGDLAAAGDALAAGETTARAHRLAAFEATFAWARATMLAAHGRLVAAEQTTALAYDLHQRTQVAAELARLAGAIHLADQRGDPAEATEAADVLAMFDDHGYLYQARSQLAAGLAVDRSALEPRLAAVLDQAPTWHRITRLSVVGHLVADLGLTDLVDEAERALEPFNDELIVLGTALACAGPVAGVLAKLDLARGRPDVAASRFGAALAGAEASGLRGWEAPLALGLAEAQHAAGEPAAAVAAAEQAMAVATRVGQPGVVDAAARLRRPLRAIDGGRAAQTRVPRVASAEP